MQEDDTTREAVCRFRSRFRLRIVPEFGELREVPAADFSEAAEECLFYLEAIITLQMMVEPDRLMGFEGASPTGKNIRSLLLTLGELCLSLSDEASHYIQKLELAYDHLAPKSGEGEPKVYIMPVGEMLDEITNILTKTHTHVGDAAEVTDIEALTAIYNLLFKKQGGITQ
jgi:hypothetical protein